MPTIRIDDEVYAWLRGRAIPFEDTPNSVLRKVAGLVSSEEESKDRPQKQGKSDVVIQRTGSYGNGGSARKPKQATGKQLIKRWKLRVRQARFHRDGHYYEHLTSFPAALCDPMGYLIFETEDDYKNCQSLQLGQQVNVKQPGISSILGYQTVDDPLSGLHTTKGE